MSYIVFQSRTERHQVLSTNMLSTSEETSDELQGFLPGDSVCIQIDISEELVESLLAQNSLRAFIREKVVEEKKESPQYEASLNFRIVKRLHHVSRDWMNRHRTGFRSSGTTIFVEAETGEEEDIFIRLQAHFDSQINQLLY